MDKEMEGFVEDFAEEYNFRPNGQNDRLGRTSQSHMPIKGKLAIWDAAILLLSLFITLFFGGGGGISRDELTAVNARIEEIEVKLSKLESSVERLGKLDTGGDSLKRSVASLENSVDSIKKQLAGLTAKVEARRQTAAPTKTPQKKTGTAPGHGLYHTVKKGDTLFSIADKYDLTLDELLKMNNLKKDAVLNIGQKLLVVPVKK